MAIWQGEGNGFCFHSSFGRWEDTDSIANPDKANELYLSFTDPRGFVVDEYLIPVGEQKQNELPQWLSQPTKLKVGKKLM